jgi:hypothetical protein
MPASKSWSLKADTASFPSRNIQYKLQLEDTYRATLDAMGPRTRRSLRGQRRQLETRTHVAFLPVLEPAQALEAMMRLRARSLAKSTTWVCRARYRLLQEASDFLLYGFARTRRRVVEHVEWLAAAQERPRAVW